MNFRNLLGCDTIVVANKEQKNIPPGPDQTECLQHKVFKKLPAVKNLRIVVCLKKLLRNFSLENFEKCPNL